MTAIAQNAASDRALMTRILWRIMPLAILCLVISTIDRTNIGFALDLDISDPGFREWLRKTIPLMLGVSLVTADDWLIRYFASGGQGDITRLNYAKRLFQGPMAILGQAAGAASLPFFARLYNEKRLSDFAKSVSDSVYRIAAISLLLSAWMIAANCSHVVS